MNLTKRLVRRYGVNKPIFIGNVAFEGLSKGYVKTQMAKLAKNGEISRYARGIYYVPRTTIFGKSRPSVLSIIEKKYLCKNRQVIGFYSGANLENLMGLSTQNPFVTEITTNAATSNKRVTVGGYAYCLLKKPRIKITNKNVNALKLLNIIERIDVRSFTKDDFKIISDFIKRNNLTKEQVLGIAEFYPKRVMGILKKTELIDELI